MDRIALNPENLMGIRACLSAGGDEPRSVLLDAKEGAPTKDGTSCDNQPVVLGRKEGTTPVKLSVLADNRLAMLGRKEGVNPTKATKRGA